MAEKVKKEGNDGQKKKDRKQEQPGERELKRMSISPLIWILDGILILLGFWLLGRWPLAFLGIPLSLIGCPVAVCAAVNLCTGRTKSGKDKFFKISYLTLGAPVYVLGLALMFRSSVLGTFLELPLLAGTLLYLIYFVLAPADRWFTFVQEGTKKAIMRGDGFLKMFIQWAGSTLDNQWNVVPEGVPVKNGKVVPVGTEGSRIYKEPWHPLMGLRFIGPFWPLDYVHKREFEWTSLAPDGRSPEHHKREILDSILLETVNYYGEATEAEDKQAVKVTVKYYLRIRTINGWRMLFIAKNWLELVLAEISSSIRSLVGSQWLYKEMMQKQADVIMSDEFKKPGGIFERFLNEWGVLVEKMGFLEIIPPENVEKAAQKQFEAEQEALKIVTLAEANKKAVIIASEGEVARIENIYSTIDKHGDVGKLVRGLEAVEKSPGEGNKLIALIPGFGELLNSAFPGREVSQILPAEFKDLRGLLQEIVDKIPRLLGEKEGGAAV